MVPGYFRWPCGGSYLPSGVKLIGEVTSALPRRCAMVWALANTRKLCLPVAMAGPFCSVPPLGTMTVVFPAAMASRISYDVIRSIRTLSAAVAGAPRQRTAIRARYFFIGASQPFLFLCSSVDALDLVDLAVILDRHQID